MLTMWKPLEKIKVLFVCMGNICRSPAAEGVFREYVRKAGFNEVIEISSAGTISYHAGSPPDRRMLRAASRRGYKLESLARQVTREDFERFDLVIAMDHINLQDLQELIGDASNVRLLGSFLKRKQGDFIPAVPDPYEGGAEGFETVLDMIEAACPAVLEYCLNIVNNRPQ
jgi:protein-tyrosine phosphatase